MYGNVHALAYRAALIIRIYIISFLFFLDDDIMDMENVDAGSSINGCKGRPWMLLHIPIVNLFVWWERWPTQNEIEQWFPSHKKPTWCIFSLKCQNIGKLICVGTLGLLQICMKSSASGGICPRSSLQNLLGPQAQSFSPTPRGLQ